MPEFTTIRVSREVKEPFDRLQGWMLSKTGRRWNQSELLARLLELADDHLDELVDVPRRPRGEGRPPGREP